MAIFFGAHSPSNPSGTINFKAYFSSIATSLKSENVFFNNNICIGYLDLQIWEDESTRLNEHGLIAIAGQPVPNATSDFSIKRIDLLDKEFTVANTLFRDFSGSFASMFYNIVSDKLILVTDKLGVRPVYYAYIDNIFFFSNALWVLSGIELLTKELNPLGLAETLAIGHPLSDRTIFRDIQVLSPGSLLESSSAGLTKKFYWNWVSEIGEKTSTLSVDELQDLFRTSVVSRLGKRDRATAFLSGGMDSRWIVEILSKFPISIDTINFAPFGTKDQVFGKLASIALSTSHMEYPGENLSFADRLVDSINLFELSKVHHNGISRLRTIWSGDGGSVGVGHVYLTKEILDEARQSGLDCAAKKIVVSQKYHVPMKLVREKYRHIFSAIYKSIHEELNLYASLEPGRACHLFFMMNDQRRHLFSHYENIHKSRIDFFLPFFDSRMVLNILKSPVDGFLYHRFYNEVFNRFAEPIRSVPWQSYPGHIKCPFSYSENLRDQWADGWMDNNARKKEKILLCRQGFVALKKILFRKTIIHKPYLMASLLLSSTNLRSYDYFIETAIKLINIETSDIFFDGSPLT
ncbi:MAG TPA: asparagine synthase-related protein [Victivallales bacterium]|nr:asparagine synthase-related protein [Victivallales bacterium]